MLIPSLLDRPDVRVVYDNKGVKREVLMSYDTFNEIVEFLNRHAYFYSETVQERLRRSDDDLKTGRYIEVSGKEIDKALEWLHG
jgi:hypothetical protein